MKIGCVKEIKKHEYRVGCTPANVHEYVNAGHSFFIEEGAGISSGYTDEEYERAGAKIVKEAANVWNEVDMMIKIKEPLESEFKYFREGLILYTYLHLAANKELTEALLKSKVTGIAYETLVVDGTLPLLKPMSEVAGRLSIQEGARCLEKPFGGNGTLLGGVTGVAKGNILIIGGGVVGINAAKVALGMGANVTIMDKNLARLEYIDFIFNSQIQTLYSSDYAIEEQLKSADLVIGAVLIPGGSTPKLIKKEYLKNMKEGSVIVDVAVDQGGCIETSHPTYHDDPTFVVDGVIHYCVGNMPGAVPVTSTAALTNATIRYGLYIANKGVDAVVNDYIMKTAVNTLDGEVTHEGVAKALNLNYKSL